MARSEGFNSRHTDDDIVESLKDFIEFIAGHLVDDPRDVEVRDVEDGRTIVLELLVPPEELGKVIGRQGRTAQAIRTLMNVVASKSRKKIVLEILE